MTSQSLQISSPEDSLARLRIVTNGIVFVYIVFRICIADCRRVPMRIQSLTYLFLFHGLLQLLVGFHVHLPCAMKPGTPDRSVEIRLPVHLWSPLSSRLRQESGCQNRVRAYDRSLLSGIFVSRRSEGSSMGTPPRYFASCITLGFKVNVPAPKRTTTKPSEVLPPDCGLLPAIRLLSPSLLGIYLLSRRTLN